MQLNTFIKKIIVFLAPLILLLALALCLLFNFGYFPAITNSVSLDAKVLDYRAHKFKKIDLLSIGSSMNLSNVNSSELKLPENLTTYYNYGAWGLQISDILYLVKYLSNKHATKCVLVSSSITDFEGSGAIVLPLPFELELIDNYLPYFYFKSNLVTIFTRHLQYKKFRENGGYDNLDFDKSGGITLDIPTNKISKTRWNQKMNFPTQNTDYQYDKLQELASFLKSRNITFVYVQAPIRRALVDSADANAKVRSHFTKCKSIVSMNGGHYLNLHNPAVFNDTLFVDQYHLSSKGSIIYTKQISMKISELFK